MHSMCKIDHKAKKDDNSNSGFAAAKAVLNNAWKAWDKAETKARVVGAKIFQLYANLLSDESCQPWDRLSRHK